MKTKRRAAPPILFCNVGWMQRYEGMRSNDPISHGGAYVEREGRGDEVCNFSPHRGRLYGFVQPTGKFIDVERLGAPPGSSSIGGVTVVWTATAPKGGTWVVGWYKDATVYRMLQKFKEVPVAQARNGLTSYRISAPKGGARRLSVDERTLVIPRKTKGGMGQSNVWYAAAPESAPVVRRVREFIAGRTRPKRPSASRQSKQDQQRKALIERRAIQRCWEHYEKLGYAVKSVEKDNIGWDLEARHFRTTLRIEVKGLGGSQLAVELTPREYEAFREQDTGYRLAIVTGALDQPELSVWSYSRETNAWTSDSDPGRSLAVETKTGASIKLT